MENLHTQDAKLSPRRPLRKPPKNIQRKNQAFKREVRVSTVRKCCRGYLMLFAILQMTTGMILAALHVVLTYAGDDVGKDLQTPLPVYTTAILSSISGLFETIIVKVSNSCVLLITICFSLFACVASLTGLLFTSSVAMPKYLSFSHFRYDRQLKQCVAFTQWDMMPNGTYTDGVIYSGLSSCSVVQSTLPPLTTVLVVLYAVACTIALLSCMFQGIMICLPRKCFFPKKKQRQRRQRATEFSEIGIPVTQASEGYVYNKNRTPNISNVQSNSVNLEQRNQHSNTCLCEPTDYANELSPIRRPGPVTVSATVSERRPKMQRQQGIHYGHFGSVYNSPTRPVLRIPSFSGPGTSSNMQTSTPLRPHPPRNLIPRRSQQDISSIRENIPRKKVLQKNNNRRSSEIPPNTQTPAANSSSSNLTVIGQENNRGPRLQKMKKIRPIKRQSSPPPPPYTELPAYEDLIVELDSPTIV